MPTKKRKTETLPQARRLQFLSDFLAATHTEAPEVADFMKISRASVYSWFSEKCDDIRLAQAMDIVDYKGYSLNISLVRPGDEDVPVVADYQSVIDNHCGGNAIKLRRLSFLFIALDRYNIGVMSLIKAIGVQYTTFRYWCCTDNLMVSRIFQIADACGLNIIFDIRRKPSGDKAPAGSAGRRCEIRINLTGGYDLSD